MEEAIFLTRFASKVTIINRSNIFKASKIMYERAVSNQKIQIIKNSIIKEWKMDDNDELTDAICCNNDNSEIFTVPCKGAFIAIGHKPSSGFLDKQIEIDDHGYIILKNNTMTSTNGIFACGDVCDKRYKQAVTACASGCMAAIDCEKWLENII
jgi:thioredoxin reductase (NADPH)